MTNKLNIINNIKITNNVTRVVSQHILNIYSYQKLWLVWDLFILQQYEVIYLFDTKDFIFELFLYVCFTKSLFVPKQTTILCYLYWNASSNTFTGRFHSFFHIFKYINENIRITWYEKYFSWKPYQCNIPRYFLVNIFLTTLRVHIEVHFLFFFKK